jgi:FtsP/CotA-like multicopper oxidase with cupredoxin domain
VLAVLKTNNTAWAPISTMPLLARTPDHQHFEGLAEAPVSVHRKLYFSQVLSNPSDAASPTNFYITVDGATPTPYSPTNPRAITTINGFAEEWTIEHRAEEAHGFHMHQIHSQLLQRNGETLPSDQQQFLDTVQVPSWSGTGPYSSITVKMDFRGEITGDFVYHCHIFRHEDGGMTAIVRVLPRT